MSANSEGAPSSIALQRVSYRMTDQMGVVYYANYLELFEIGRGQLLRNSGFSYANMESDGFFLPVIHAECDYLSPARYDDLLEIRTSVARLTRVRLDFEYEIRRKGSEAVLARGVTRHAIVDAHGRPRRLDAVWQERLTLFAEGAGTATAS